MQTSDAESTEPYELKRGLTLLGPRLRGLMISLSVMICFVIAWLVPFLYERAILNERSLEAELSARALSASISHLVSAYPSTWIYRHRELQKKAMLITGGGSSVQVVNERGVSYLIDQAGVRRAEQVTPLDEPVVVGVAVIEGAGGSRGKVTVKLLSIEHLNEGLWLIAILLGAFTSLVISIVPLWISQQGDKRNESLWLALQALNQTLEHKISQRTAELDQINGRLMNVQEEERARISRDLHDELGQTLTAARLQLTTAQLLPQGSQEALSLYEGGLRELDQGVEQVRSIAYALRPPELDELGLEVALTRHVTRRAKSAGLTAHIVFKLPPQPMALSTTIFRVVQEGLTNVIRHAQASCVEVKVTCDEEGVVCVAIEDNGAGLSALHQEGVGLLGLRSRVREHGGEVKLIGGEVGVTLKVTLKPERESERAPAEV